MAGMPKFLRNFVDSLMLMGFRSTRDEFYEQLARSFEQRESLQDFLIEEMRIANNPKTKDASKAYAFKLMRMRLESGTKTRYADILDGIVPATDNLMLASLDDAPDKPMLMRAVAESVVKQRELLGIVKSKIIPPLLILPGAYAFAYTLATKSIPIIVKVAPDEVWSAFNMTVRVFSEVVKDYSGALIIGVLLGIAALVYQLPRWIGKSRSKVEGMSAGMATALFPVAPFCLPVVIYRDIQAGLLFTALSVMLRSGRTLTDSLSLIRLRSSPWMRWQISRILAHLDSNPTEYAKAFSKGLLSPKLLARLSSQIRTTPNFDTVLISLGQQGADEVKIEVSSQMSKINSMLLAAGGFLVLFMMAGQMAISQTMSDEMSPSKQMQRQMLRAQKAQSPSP